MIKVLFVCLGNICRSPMAHMVFQNMINEKGLASDFEIDSAGTEGYNEMCHSGIHRGTKEILRRKGIPFEEHYSRKIRKKDYEYFDYIVAMDAENIEDIECIVGQDKDNFSGVSCNPLTLKETINGAKNRAKNAFEYAEERCRHM